MIDLYNEIKNALKAQSEKYQKSLNFDFNIDKQKKYIIGKNEESLAFASRYKVDGLIDDYSQDVMVWNNIPLIKSSQIERDSLVVNCVTSISPVDVMKRLKKFGICNIVEIDEIISNEEGILPLPWFVAQQRIEIEKNLTWYSELYNRMFDDVSRRTLLDVLRYRLTASSDYMKNYVVRLKDQYFEDFMQYGDEVFIDAGGYDGDTTEEFITRYPTYKKVYIFEPSQSNILAAKKRLVGRMGIEFRSVGLSDANGVLNFNSHAGSASAITNSQGEFIPVVTLDSELPDEKISFIKMDLEGWEMHALRGTENIIKNKKPKLAIAVYHAAKDFREIPQYLLGINPDYKVSIRHYTQGWSETVMYFY